MRELILADGKPHQVPYVSPVRIELLNRHAVTGAYADEDYRFCPDHLNEQAAKHDCQIHAYCLMTNHVHLLMTPGKTDSLGKLAFMKFIEATHR